jgi:hypothetical protein
MRAGLPSWYRQRCQQIKGETDEHAFIPDDRLFLRQFRIHHQLLSRKGSPGLPAPGFLHLLPKRRIDRWASQLVRMGRCTCPMM